ncbi:MAG: hypothetical protein C0469_10685 [Cyanobacteria bacterium DS2.3.42]|nr:hypothetical protein [Cyanobacteria bacterium DS2.3.42]
MLKSYQMKNTATAAMILSVIFSSLPATAAPQYKKKTTTITTTRYNTASMPGAPLIAVPFRSWIPRREKPRVVLLCIHALGFSSNSYDNFGRRMAAAGIPTFAMDVRGFGKWMTKKGEGEMDFEACLTDVEQAVKTLHAAYPKVPVFLVGESMGGAIAIQAASRYPDQVNGLVSAVPSATSRGGGMLKSGMVVAYHTATPMAKVDMTPVVVDGSTSNEALRQKIEDDPNNRMELSRKEIVQFERFMKATHDAAPLVERTPALVLVAYKDKLVTPGGSVDLFSEMTTAQKLLIGDGNSGHLMLEEGQMTPEIERILKNWLFEKSGSAAQSRNVASN